MASGFEHPRVLLVEDDDAVREGVAAALTANGYEVVALADGTGVGEAMRLRPADVAVLDVSLPTGPDGFAIAAGLRGDRGTPVIFLTAADAEEDRLRGFDLGADDYVVKPFSVRELMARLQVVLRRAGIAGGSSLRVRDVVIDLVDREVRRAGALVPLTPLEFDILAALASTPGRAWSKRQLLAHVWGLERYAPHLVEVHVSSLRRKIEQHGNRLLSTARGVGYVVSP
ncbi:MAG: response regulator transcription factor [Actinobacteria bacterium]|nr:response regulator transcription factor [Actinomycetota bacterium]